MATATRKNPTPPPPPAPKVEGESRAGGSLIIQVFDTVFRFLASVKLAVISLFFLSATLAYGTQFTSANGMTAAGEWIYQTRWFALVLAFLAMNILCAALIRFPWSKRQTGFVITHAGLLTVIAGSWWCSQAFDEGQVGLREGETSSTLIRTTRPTLFVRPFDPHTQEPTGEYSIPFRPGSFDWPEGSYKVISNAKDPFKLAIKRFYVASIPKTVFVSDPDGSPMIKIHPMAKFPGETSFQDILSEEQSWLNPERILGRVTKKIGPSQFNFTYVTSHEIFDDFLDIPADPGQLGVARLHYKDKSGQNRFVDVRIDDAQAGKPFPLPDSDLTASFGGLKRKDGKDDEDGVIRALLKFTRLDELVTVEFRVKQGNGPEITHTGYASLPMIPPIMPSRDERAPAPPQPLIQVGYYLPPLIDKDINGRTGLVEIMGNDHGELAYRVYRRGNPGTLGAHGRIKPGEVVTAFGGDPSIPMTMKLSIDEFLQSGKEAEIAESVNLPIGQKDEGYPAVLAELTVKGVTKEVWLRKSPSFDPGYTTVTFPDGVYQVAFDYDHLDLGFSLKLEDFDVGFDPGTNEASSFRSEVKLTDESMGIKDKPVSIYMNNVLDHRGWRFFQSRYQRHYDPKTGRPTGEFISVFQVARNPARYLVYFGCIVVVLGAFTQFYMRAGIFSDGGKREQQRAAEKARKRLEAKFGKTTTPAAQPQPEAEEHEPL